MRTKRRRLSTEVFQEKPALSSDAFLREPGLSTDVRFEETAHDIDSNVIFNSSQVEDNFFDSSFETKEHSNHIDLNTSFHQSNNVKKDIHSFLISWSLKHHVPHVAINDLLRYLQTIFPELPSDARTLLKTCRDIQTKTITPGEYHHFGLKYCLEKLRSKNLRTFETKTNFELDINVDGLPLAKSSNSQVYPILCKLKDSVSVEMIGIYHGYEKPKSANEFLESFVLEITDLINNGIEINGQMFMVKINSFICDVPAKAFITYTKGHSGYASCTKCMSEGEFISNRVCFPDIEGFTLRTDETFKSQIQESHHTGTSILENIPGINMVNDFPLDYMHLVCLGVVKKLLVLLWCYGKPSSKLQFQKISDISEYLSKLSKHVPIEFTRKPRSLLEVKRWKATEYRQFLYYTGPVVLKNSLNNNRYLNFLTLHVGITILSSRNHFQYLNYASDLFKYFVKTFKILYGAEHTSHNIHNLLHLTEDVKKFGPLENFSSFPFENFLQSILKTLRKKDKPLAQIIKRNSEMPKNVCANPGPSNFPMYEIEHQNGPLMNFKVTKQYKRIVFEHFLLKNKEPDNCCSLLNGDIILIENFVLSMDEKCNIIGRKFMVSRDFYKDPCPSSNLGIYHVSSIGSLELLDISDIKHKCVKFPYKNDFIIFPLIHTL